MVMSNKVNAQTELIEVPDINESHLYKGVLGKSINATFVRTLRVRGHLVVIQSLINQWFSISDKWSRTPISLRNSNHHKKTDFLVYWQCSGRPLRVYQWVFVSRLVL